MQTAPIVEALRREVAAASGDPALAAVVERLAGSLESATRLWLLDTATAAAAELTAQLPTGRVEVRLTGPDPELVYVADAESDHVSSGDDATVARITLRLPESLKSRVEAWAAAEGVSVNTWLVRTIARGGESSRRTVGRRLTGYGQS